MSAQRNIQKRAPKERQLCCYQELAFLLGIVILALGTAFMEKADLGMSMVVAPAYLLHLKLSESVKFFSFGMAEYVLQAVLILLITVILRRFKRYYLFSFVTAVLYGFTLDGAMWLVGHITGEAVGLRILYYLLGMVLGSIGIAFFFHTYIAPEAYELLVKEIAERYHFSIARVKTVYDCTSCFISIGMSFAFFGFGVFEGIKWGTILCALINGWMIGRISGFLDKIMKFPRLWGKS